MYTHFIEFIKSILQPIQEILKLLSPNLGMIVGICITFLVALAVKRGVTH